MARVPHSWANAREHPIIAALHDFFCQRSSIWLRTAL
jgi:hypothetical protein